MITTRLSPHLTLRFKKYLRQNTFENSNKEINVVFKNIICTVVFLISGIVLSQTMGDYRSIGDGDWTDPANWEYYNGTTWVAATYYPGDPLGPTTNDVFVIGGNTIILSSDILGSMSSVTIGDGITPPLDRIELIADAFLNTLILFANDGGVMDWENSVDLILPAGAAFIVALDDPDDPNDVGGFLDNSIPCSSSKRLRIGDAIFASCNGEGGGQDNPFSFADLMANGGSIYVAPSSNSPICEGEDLNLMANPSGTGATDPTNIFVWTGTGPGGYTFNSTDQDPVVSGLEVGTYTYEVTITHQIVFTFTASIEVVVNPLPTAIASNSSPVCPNTDITLNETGGDAVSWFWTTNSSSATIVDATSQMPIVTGAVNGDIFTVEITDSNGCVITDTTTVTVEDLIDPVPGCPSDIFQGTDATGCNAVVTWTEPTVSDNCSVTSFISTHSPGDTFPLGTTTVTYTATDAGGNTSSCSFDITITDDDAPVISGCPADISQGNDATSCNAVVTWTEPTASDNCGVTSFTSTHSPGDTFSLGTTTVTYTAMDATGNTSTCSFDITVTDDEDPVITCPGDITQTADAGVCQAVVTVPLATVTDNCGATITNDYNGGGADASDTYPLGTTTVTFTATDAAGNSVTCSIDITVTDDEDPVITCPGDITQTADAGVCEAVVTVPLATVTDNCGATITNDYNGGGADASDTYPVGTTTVTFTAIDVTGNSVSCSIDITITDDEAPVITLTGSDPQVLESCSSYVELGASVSDCEPGLVVVIDSSAVDMSTPGNYTVTYNVTDTAGNAATEVTRTVSVVDTTAPVITLTGSDPQVLESCSSYVELGASVSDCEPGLVVVIDSSA
ncbi:HYR domain-containing protein, partial [Aestuariivivens marinum]|uniref:HYR domain-containing protein n=1 Tax=Aestuariivivens marinum TaxID=2913555 RepID=UPI001F5852F9